MSSSSGESGTPVRNAASRASAATIEHAAALILIIPGNMLLQVNAGGIFYNLHRAPNAYSQRARIHGRSRFLGRRESTYNIIYLRMPARIRDSPMAINYKLKAIRARSAPVINRYNPHPVHRDLKLFLSRLCANINARRTTSRRETVDYIVVDLYFVARADGPRRCSPWGNPASRGHSIL